MPEPRRVTSRKQLSMVLPELLIAAIKHRAARRGQSITAYITRLVEQDLASDDALATDGDTSAPTLLQRLERVEERLNKLEQQTL